jgi:hypothetical protein
VTAKSTVAFRDSPDTERAWLAEAAVPVSRVLAALLRWRSFDRMVRFSFPKPVGEPWGRDARRVSWSDVHASAEFALSKINAGADLSPPVISALTEGWSEQYISSLMRSGESYDPSLLYVLKQEWSTSLRGTIEVVREAAPATLGSLLARRDPPSEENDLELTDPLDGKALRYAVALVREGRLPASRHADAGTFIRDAVPDDVRAQLFDFSVYLSEKIDGRITPENLLGRWKRHVEETESGKSVDYAVLWSNLEQRDLLEKMILIVPNSVRALIANHVSPLDERYELATDASPAPIYGRSAPWRVKAWWWYRTPRGRVP